MGEKTKENENNKAVDWDRLQSWLQEATAVLEYCTRLAIAKGTGDIEGAIGDNGCFKMQFVSDDEIISEERIRGYVVNIGRLAEAGWETNDDFPFFVSIKKKKEERNV